MTANNLIFSLSRARLALLNNLCLQPKDPIPLCARCAGVWPRWLGRSEAAARQKHGEGRASLSTALTLRSSRRFRCCFLPPNPLYLTLRESPLPSDLGADGQDGLRSQHNACVRSSGPPPALSSRRDEVAQPVRHTVHPIHIKLSAVRRTRRRSNTSSACSRIADPFLAQILLVIRRPACC